MGEHSSGTKDLRKTIQAIDFICKLDSGNRLTPDFLEACYEEIAALLQANKDLAGEVERLERRCETFVNAYKEFGMDIPGAPSIAKLEALADLPAEVKK